MYRYQLLLRSKKTREAQYYNVAAPYARAALAWCLQAFKHKDADVVKLDRHEELDAISSLGSRSNAGDSKPSGPWAARMSLAEYVQAFLTAARLNGHVVTKQINQNWRIETPTRWVFLNEKNGEVWVTTRGGGLATTHMKLSERSWQGLVKVYLS